MAKHNKQQEQERITGFQLGGLVPLEAVGHVMAALYEHGAENLQIAPFMQNVTVGPAIRRRLSDNSGIAGLLPSPNQPAIGVDREAALIEIVSTAPPEGLKKNDIMAALEERGIKGTFLDGSTGKGLMARGILQRVSMGMYVLGPNANAHKPDANAAPELPLSPPEGEQTGKRDVILRYLISRGAEGAQRSEIQEMLGERGFKNQYFDPRPLQELLDAGQVARTGKGQYAVTGNAAPASNVPQAKKAWTPPANGKKTIRTSIIAALQEAHPNPVTKEELSARIVKEMDTTELSVLTELSATFRKGLIARPAKGTYTLPPQ